MANRQEIVVNDFNYEQQLRRAEFYIDNELPTDLEEWYDELIVAIVAYEEDLWPVDDEVLDDEGGTL